MLRLPDAAGTTRRPHGVERTLAVDDVLEVQARVQAEQNVDVRQSQIRVEQHRAAALGRERGAEIYRHDGLADSALAARDRDHVDGPRRAEPAQAGRLIDHPLIHALQAPSRQNSPRARSRRAAAARSA
jgi:hypothetical protein